jgi:hypothetical protein
VVQVRDKRDWRNAKVIGVLAGVVSNFASVLQNAIQYKQTQVEISRRKLVHSVSGKRGEGLKMKKYKNRFQSMASNRRARARRLARRQEALYAFDVVPELEELADAQGVSPVDNFDDLLGDFWPEDESVDDFLEARERWRREGQDSDN